MTLAVRLALALFLLAAPAAAARDVGPNQAVPPAKGYTRAQLQRACVPMHIGIYDYDPTGTLPCRFEFGRVEGPAGAPELVYQVQYADDQQWGGDQAVVVLAPAPGGYAPLAWMNCAPCIFQAPELHANPTGWLLYLPGRVMGSVYENHDRLLRLEGGRWSPIELPDGGPAPEGFSLQRGLAFDFDHMTATTDLYREGDGQSEPSGGVLEYAMGFDGPKLVITGMNRRARGG